MSTQQLAEILEISAQNPPPANATPPMMRAWAEGITSHTPLAQNVRIGRSSFGPYGGDLILPDGGDASRLNRALVEEQKLAVAIGGGWPQGFDANLFYIQAILPAGGSVAQFETAFDAELRHESGGE